MKELLAKFIDFISNKKPLVLIVELFSVLIFLTWIAIIYQIMFNFSATKNVVDTVIQAYEKVNVENVVNLNGSIDTELRILLTKTNADRTFINRYHDNKTDLSGDHFLYMSRSNEIQSAGVAATILNNQRLPLSLFGTSEDFEEGKCLAYIDIKRTDISWYDFWREAGINSAIYCPIFDANHKLVGTIGVDYVIQHPDLVKKDSIINAIKDSSNRISGILGVAAKE